MTMTWPCHCLSSLQFGNVLVKTLSFSYEAKLSNIDSLQYNLYTTCL